MKFATNLKYSLLIESVNNLGFFTNFFTFIWGFWLILPFQTFGTSKSFQILTTVPEYTYGIVLCTLSAFAIYQSLIDKSPKFIDFALALWWLMITALVGITQWRSTGIATYGVITIVYAFLYLRRVDE